MRKFFLYFITIFIFLINSQTTFSDENIETLKKLLSEGLITEEEFKKASSKSINSNEISNDRIKIRKSTTSKNVKFVKYEFYIDNYRIHTLGPGAIRADNLLTGETDVKIGGNFKSKFTNEGKKYFDLSLDKENLSAKLNYKGRMLINWSGKYVAHHSATFYQMQVLGYMPFHFYIMLKGKNPISLNIDKFNRKIEKAVNRVKEEMAIKFDISIEDIDKILERKNKSINDPEVLEALNAQLSFKEKIEKNTSLVKDISMGAFDDNRFKKFADENSLTVQNYKISNLKQNDIFEEGLIKRIFLTKDGQINLITNSTLTKSFLILTKNTEYKNLNKNSNEFEQYEAKARLNLINKIYQSYDENVNQKYNVKLNQRTIDRVKNSFQ